MMNVHVLIKFKVTIVDIKCGMKVSTTIYHYVLLKTHKPV